jgi:hypothetical protein
MIRGHPNPRITWVIRAIWRIEWQDSGHRASRTLHSGEPELHVKTLKVGGIESVEQSSKNVWKEAREGRIRVRDYAAWTS